MARRGTRRPVMDARINLTPLIDVTFQLIIFFMLVTELTNLSLAEVRLPTASNTTEGEPAPLIVNVVRESASGDGFIRIGADTYRGRGTELTDRLRDRFQLEAEVFGVWTEGAGARRSELSVVVRSDRGVRAEYFLCILWACNDVGIYKISAGAQQEDPDRPSRHRRCPRRRSGGR